MAEPLEDQPGIQPGTPLLQAEAPGRFYSSPSEEIRAKGRLSWVGQVGQRSFIDAPPDPGYRPWQDMKGYEAYASTLSKSRSKTETDALKGLIDRNKRDQQTAASGELGLLGDLVAGAFDPVNLIPIPFVKGIGLVRGALYTGAAFGAITAGTEIARINADPTAQWSDMPGNIGLASLLGGIVGAPIGMWGARAARAERAIRAFEADIGNVDSPFHSLRPRSQPGLRFESGRPARAADGTYPLFAQAEEVIGYEPKVVDGVSYVSEDGVTWTTKAEQGRAGPLAVSDELAEHLGQPKPITELVQKGDEVRVKAEFNKGQWHDELQSYIDGNANVRHVVRDANDYYNFRHYQHIYEKSLPRLATETAEAWRQRVGTEAMREYRGSQQGGDYAGFLAQMLGRMNFSPVVKAIRLARGDNRVAELSLGIGGDYKWAIEGNQTRWSTPPSLILNSMRQHTPRYHRFLNEFEAEWVKYASGNQNYGGRTFQGLNVSAAAYKLKRGLRRGGGANGMTHADFEEMVAEAVFNPNDFEVRGFPVNENARAAAKAFTRMAQEYDDLLRASGAFRDQKNLARDLKHWNRQIVYHQNAVMKWLWGETGKPANLLHAIRVKVAAQAAGTPAPAADVLRLYRGEGGSFMGSVEGGGWFTTDLEKARIYAENGGRITYIDAPARVSTDEARAFWIKFAQGHGGPDEWLTTDPGIIGMQQPFLEGGAGTGDRVFTGASHDEAIQNMMDALGDEGVPLSENLTANNYGYTYRETAGAAAIEDPTGMKYDPAFERFTTTGQALQHVIDNDYSPELKAVAERIKSFTGDVRFKVVHAIEPGEGIDIDVPSDLYSRMVSGIMGYYAPGEIGGRVFLRGLGFNKAAAGASTMVHEALHAAAWDRINQGLKEADTTALGRSVAQLEELRKHVNSHYLGEASLPSPLREYQISNIHELVSYGLSDREFQDWLKTIKLPNGETGFSAFVRWLGELLGFGEGEHNALAQVMQLSDEILPETGAPSVLKQQLDADAARREARYPALSRKKAAGVVGEGFTLSKDAPGLLENQPDRMPAVQYEDRIFTGGDHATAFEAAKAHLGDEFETAFEENPEAYLGYYRRPEPKANAGGPAAVDAEPAFVTVDEAMDQRVRRLTPAQRAIYDERAGGLAAAQESLAKTQADLKTVTEMPHQFLDANGKPEPWFHRVWDKSKGATEREQLTRLITRWFERDNPDGARQRAELAIDNILNDSAEIADTGTLGMSPLRQRTLNVPNSWSIEDPQFGTLKISDFIDKRITAIAEHYSKRAGVIVESARMFGPGGIKQAFAEQREYLMSTYWEKASDADKPGVLEWINEIEGEQQLAYDTVAGTLRTSDPQKVTNRISRLMQSISTLGVMGKIAFAQIPEILRPGMVNGFGTQFRVVLQKYIGDLELLRGNTELNELTGELFDLASKQMHIQAVTIQDGEPSLGGTWMENLINDQVPNLYKISGMTSITTWQKTIAGLAAQHSVMSQAIAVGEAMRAGKVPDAKMVMRLNAMGINVRDALLLSEMPVEHYQGGKLILPAVDGWGNKAQGRRAREVLLNGIHAEMRRTIVTPSVGDRSTIFNGVWTSRGKKQFESDIMTIPMQFLSYGMGAHNALLISGLQGRDHSLVLGMFYLTLMGMFAEWYRTDSKVWMRKGYDEMIADGIDASGMGGFWFSNLNSQIERASSGKFGLRPLAGIKTDYDKKTAEQGFASAFGVAPGYFYDISRAFWDSSVTATERAQLIRKAIPYNNVVWWARIFDEMGRGAGGAFEGTKK